MYCCSLTIKIQFLYLVDFLFLILTTYTFMYLGAGAPQATIGVRGGFRGSRVPSDTSTWELFDEIHGVVAQFVWIGHWKLIYLHNLCGSVIGS